MEPFLRYLDPREKYEDRYDRHTVERCLWFYEAGRKALDSKDLPKEIKKMSLEEREHEMRKVIHMQVYCYKGSRWENREQTINEWMQKDKDRDDRMEHVWETAKPKLNRTCEKCFGRRHKLLDKWFSHKKNRRDDDDSQHVLFLYECSKCKHRSGEYANGEVYDFNSYCPKCNSVLNKTDTTYKHKIVFRSTCPKCSYTNDYEMDLREKKEKKKTKAELKKEQDDWEEFEKNRKEFCISDKEGHEYLDFKRRMESLSEVFAEIEDKKKNKELYEKAAQIEKINIWEAQKRMKALLKGKKFVKPKFGEPNMGQDVTCEFRVYEADPAREEKDACKDLEKVIAKAFENTNWKLMSDGISYRMGILTGRIRGMEKEKDILKNITL